MKRETEEKIVAQFVEEIESGMAKPEDWVAPWHRGTHRGDPKNATTGKRYRGVNVLVLGFSGLAFESDEWATYKQWQAAGAQVKKGERGTLIVKYGTFDTENPTAQEGDPETIKRGYLKAYSVFNASQVDGFAPTCTNEGELVDQTEKIAAADMIASACGATIHHGREGAYYDRRRDAVTLPERKRFIATGEASPTENYYSTLFHELTHWTGAPHRLDRTKGQRFGDAAYAFEELIAELGAAFMCRHCEISSVSRPDHAQYLSGWLDALKAEPKTLFRAAAQAQRAVDFLSASAAQGKPEKEKEAA